MNNDEIRTHVKVEQVIKNWETVIEGIRNKETLVFVYRINGEIVTKPVVYLNVDTISDYIFDPDTALVRVTFFALDK